MVFFQISAFTVAIKEKYSYIGVLGEKDGTKMYTF